MISLIHIFTIRYLKKMVGQKRKKMPKPGTPEKQLLKPESLEETTEPFHPNSCHGFFSPCVNDGEVYCISCCSLFCHDCTEKAHRNRNHQEPVIWDKIPIEPCIGYEYREYYCQVCDLFCCSTCTEEAHSHPTKKNHKLKKIDLKEMYCIKLS
eukprot:TRINITY_DN3190_c0_g1_i2.p1 TRINITY_DN3190_c0_g1~~TRINITY_DN3190_c0_g1_i2.p1  ORF type:complete len:153 (-),score=15.66 TRINITY_DN3190_c0_g1_i2:180-638(-)